MSDTEGQEDGYMRVLAGSRKDRPPTGGWQYVLEARWQSACTASSLLVPLTLSEHGHTRHHRHSSWAVLYCSHLHIPVRTRFYHSDPLLVCGPPTPPCSSLTVSLNHGAGGSEGRWCGRYRTWEGQYRNGRQVTGAGAAMREEGGGLYSTSSNRETTL